MGPGERENGCTPVQRSQKGRTSVGEGVRFEEAFPDLYRLAYRDAVDHGRDLGEAEGGARDDADAAHLDQVPQGVRRAPKHPPARTPGDHPVVGYEPPAPPNKPQGQVALAHT